MEEIASKIRHQTECLSFEKCIFSKALWREQKDRMAEPDDRSQQTQSYKEEILYDLKKVDLSQRPVTLE